MKRRKFLGLLGGAAVTWGDFASAQIDLPPKRIGLIANSLLPPVQRFRERLQKLGYIEGKNIA
ncbi:MAG: hypothetical protein WA760_09755, partial [Pseudolabrys sp.]